MDEKTAKQCLARLHLLASQLEVEDIASFVLDNKKFDIWSGSSKPHQHHYGKYGLVIHTNEVIQLCFSSTLSQNYEIDNKAVFLAGLFHDSGKIWDYTPINEEMSEWTSTEHKRNIHHISRSALNWREAFLTKKHNFDEQFCDDVLHAILAHHQLREWGSPVCPKSKLAWMLHLCDSISARMYDCGSWDMVGEKNK